MSIARESASRTSDAVRLENRLYLEPPPFDHSVMAGGCMQRSTSVCLRAEGLEPPVLLGKFWRFCREWGPPFRNKSTHMVTEGAFHVFAGVFDDARDALKRHGIRVAYCQGMGPDASWQGVRERLASGRPTPVLLDDFYLPVSETFFQKIHSTHVYALHGFDAETDTVHFVNVTDRVRSWAVPYRTFVQSWSLEEFSWYDVLVPAALNVYTTTQLAEDLRANLAGMLPEHDGEHWAFGVPAIRRLAADLLVYGDRFPDEAIKGFLEDGFHQLVNMREQRRIHGLALRLIAQQLGLECLAAIGRRLEEELAPAWRLARNWCVRAMEMDDLGKGLGRLRDKLEEVADMEEATLRELRPLLDAPSWPSHVPIDVRLRRWKDDEIRGPFV